MKFLNREMEVNKQKSGEKSASKVYPSPDGRTKKHHFHVLEIPM
jgi:hypothetical protein